MASFKDKINSLINQAQQKIAEYEKILEQKKIEKEKAKLESLATNWFKAAKMYESQGLQSKALELLQKISPETSVYKEAKQKIAQYKKLEQEKEQLIRTFKELIPFRYGNQLKAAAFIDETLHLIDSIERKKYIDIHGISSKTNASGEFLIIRLYIRNDSKKTRTISASEITLIDSLQREFSISSEGASALSMSGDKTVELFMTELQPSLPKIISIVFDIPPTADDLKLKIPSGFLGRPVLLPLSVAL